jgi:hypothetical protein
LAADFGTTFKAYRRGFARNSALRWLHRFIPALASSSGARIAEVPISTLSAERQSITALAAACEFSLTDHDQVSAGLFHEAAPLGLLGPAGSGTGLLIDILTVVYSPQDVMVNTGRFCSFRSLSLSAESVYLDGIARRDQLTLI